MAKKKSRASNGMGSVRQRADGRWEGRYSTPDGKQKSVYGKTEAEVTRKLRGQLHEIDTGVWREPSKMTVADWMDIWLSDYQAHNSERTVVKYRCIVDHKIIPLLGKLKLSAVLPLHVRRFVNTLQADGLAPVTIKNYTRILGASFGCAIDAGLIRENPADGAKVPRTPPTQFTIIDRADIPAFVKAAEDSPYPNELLLMFYTGLRVGEMRGLRWADCDLDAGIMRVERQLHPVRHDLKQVAPPKYGESRIIHLSEEAVEVLKRQRKRQAEQRLTAGGWEDNEITADLVFRLDNGNPHNGTSIQRAVKAVGAAVGKPELHPHDLRHSYAVAALRAGIDVKTVQHNLGHKTSQMTLDVYATYTEDAGKEGAARMSEYLRNAKKEPV